MMAATVDCCVKWNGKEYKITGLSQDDTVLSLKKAITAQTGVLPERQKLLGLKYKGKMPDNEVLLKELSLTVATKIMMMGSSEIDVAAANEKPADLPVVVNDFDIDVDEIAIQDREEYLAKIQRRVREYKIEIINEPRNDKKLLVLDIDYTLFDHKSSAESGLELMRPYLHEMLTTAYEHYDIVIWSATNMKWIKAKMEELGVMQNTNYKLSFMLDSLAMITVATAEYGVIDVKALGVIWGKYPQWSAKNTIIVDDLRRNFIMNPQSGLKIRPFSHAHQNRDSDRELYRLSRYLSAIAALDDFTTLDHKKWHKYRRRLIQQGNQSEAAQQDSDGGDDQ